METIRIHDRSADVTEIVLDRPAKRNAINQQMRRELEDAMTTCQTPVLLVRGSGNTFCAGEDVDELSSVDALYDHTQELIETLEVIRTAEPVTVACIEGYALGGGMFLGAAFDLRVGIEGSEYGVPVLKLGIPPAGGGTKLLIDLVGEAEVRKLVFTADVVDAEYAVDVGYLQWVRPTVDDARSIARSIATHDGDALRTAKAYINACASAESLQAVADLEETFITDVTPDLTGRDNG